MKIAIAIEVHSKHVEDVQVFKTYEAALRSVEDNDHDWDGDAYNLPNGSGILGRDELRGRCYPLVNGEWHVQEIEVSCNCKNS